MRSATAYLWRSGAARPLRSQRPGEL